ncbi:hypothetical protein KC331_g291 [Hortaea werneckii]|nr:hypothetical protein KC331_g291 [Hortaea werneckii]KAI7722509.1 hypothetical protein KC353_g447 [Hortaea werneckii]
MLSREPGSTVTDEETGAQKKTPRRKLALVKQPYEESTYDSFWPELNLNCLHALAVEDYAYEIESHMRSRPIVTGGTQPPPLTTRVRNLYFSDDEEKRYIQIANQRGTETTVNFRDYMKACQDQAYPGGHIDEEDARPARPVHESRGSVPLKVTDLKHFGGLSPADKHVWAYESAFEVIKQYFWAP